MDGFTPRLVLTQRQKTIRNGLLSSHRLPTICYLPKWIFSLPFLYILRHVGYENQDINHCVTRLFVRFRCLTVNLSRLQFAITACSPSTLIPISRKASYRVPRSTLALLKMETMTLTLHVGLNLTFCQPLSKDKVMSRKQKIHLYCHLRGSLAMSRKQ